MRRKWKQVQEHDNLRHLLHHLIKMVIGRAYFHWKRPMNKKLILAIKITLSVLSEFFSKVGILLLLKKSDFFRFFSCLANDFIMHRHCLNFIPTSRTKAYFYFKLSFQKIPKSQLFGKVFDVVAVARETNACLRRKFFAAFRGKHASAPHASTWSNKILQLNRRHREKLHKTLHTSHKFWCYWMKNVFFNFSFRSTFPFLRSRRESIKFPSHKFHPAWYASIKKLKFRAKFPLLIGNYRPSSGFKDGLALPRLWNNYRRT